MAQRLIFRVHALEAMFRRGITLDEVREVLAAGKNIEEYPEDKPYPSRLILGWPRSRAIHVVAADDPAEQETIIITVYEPDPDRWEPGFEKRRTR